RGPPDARNPPEAGLERVFRAAGDGLVGLAEVLPPFRVADDRAGDAELTQHRRRDLACERTLVSPVDVLREDGDSVLDRRGKRCERRADHDVDTAGRIEGLQKRSRLRLRLEHLPVRGQERHGGRSSHPAGMTATPGSSLPSRNSSAAPPPVDNHETRSSSPSSRNARAESAPPTTVNAEESATAWATAFVPSAKRGHSKTPIGPFQK